MGKTDYEIYRKYRDLVQAQAIQIKDMLEEIVRRKKERIWILNQSYGEFDDNKLIDGLVGERRIFKRRGVHESSLTDLNGNEVNFKKRIQFVFDVSGSMMRFNSLDSRLERCLSAALMIMEAFPRETSKENQITSDDNSYNVSELINYSISGHSGDTVSEIFVPFSDEKNETYSKKKI